jgi:hypothetical protein
MVVISSAELRSNMKKYLDIAKTDDVIIQRGKTETFVLSMEKRFAPDDDLARAITLDELFDGVKEDIREIFRKGKNASNSITRSSSIS